MRICASWWGNLFHPPPFVLFFLWLKYNKPVAAVFYIVICHNLQWSTIIKWPHFDPATFLPLQRSSEDELALEEGSGETTKRARWGQKMEKNAVWTRQWCQPKPSTKHRDSSCALVPVPLTAALMLKSLSAAPLCWLSTKARLIQLLDILYEPTLQDGHLKVQDSTHTQIQQAFLCLTSERKVCADFCAPTCSRYSYT